MNQEKGEDTYAALYTRAVKLLAVRMRSEAELRTRLETGTRAAGPGDPHTVARVLVRLKEQRLLDDRRFAGEAARSRFVHRNQGMRRVLLELGRLGVDEVVAAEAAEEAQLKAGGRDAILQRALEKRIRVGGRPKNRKGLVRLMRHLTNNGHPPDAVRSHLARECPDLLDW